MNEKILFSLEECMKCEQTKQLIKNRDDIKIVTLPHDITDWDETQMNLTKDHEVFEDLQKTAPVLWVDGEKQLGYLRIRKWIQDHKQE
jgi:glutaredoxin